MRNEDLLPLQEVTADAPERLREVAEAEYRTIGGRNRSTDGLFKSTGKAAYTDDITFPGMLHAKILRSTEPHARILAIDAAKALELPGVYEVITGKGVLVRRPGDDAVRSPHVLAGDDFVYARQFERLRRVDRQDPRVRFGAAEDL
ncbi:MAG: hypothetical protein P8Y07_00810, partial [Gemmatimonadales bacterium]